jgi:hypothetical protein
LRPTPLFRPEALNARSQAALGPVRLAASRSLTLWTVGLVAATFALLAWLAGSGLTRTLALPGTLQPTDGPLRLHAAADGTVVQVAVREGETLPAGAPVVVVEDAGRRQVVATPAAMRVSALVVRPGQPVTTGAEVARLEPVDARWQAELTAPAVALEALPVGRPIRLRLLDGAGGDATWLDGTVTGVAREPLASPPAAVDAVPPEPHYRVTVGIAPASAADPASTPLRSGLRVQAVLPLGRRRLLDWMFGAPGQPPQ